MKIKPDDIKSIEACRPNSDDRASSDFQPVAERIQQDDTLFKFSEAVSRVDSKIADEIKKVPVPPEFKERLLAALDSNVVAKPQPSRLGVSKKNWFGLAAGISVSAACLVLALAFALPDSDERTASDFIEQASKDYAKIPFDSWVDFKQAKQKQKRLLPTGLSSDSAMLVQGSTTAPLFFSFRQPAAYLMVVSGNPARINSTFPPRPIAGTGANSGYYFGVWKSKGHVYVLAVKGSRSDFDRMNATNEKLVFNGGRTSLPHRHNRNT